MSIRKISGSRTFQDSENILLVFWASWCKPCIEELPAIIKIRNEFSSKLLKIIGISLDKNTSVVKNQVNKFKMDWINIRGSSQIINNYVTQGIPEIFLISKGKIIYTREEEELTQVNLLPILNKRLLTLNN